MRLKLSYPHSDPAWRDLCAPPVSYDFDGFGGADVALGKAGLNRETVSGVVNVGRSSGKKAKSELTPAASC